MSIYKGGVVSDQIDVLLLIMRTTALEPMHGWASAQRRACFYTLTKAGCKQLALEVSKWDRLSAGVSVVRQRT
jgi:hypothetical protein